MKNFFEWYEDKLSCDTSRYVSFTAFILGILFLFSVLIALLALTMYTYGAILLLVPMFLYSWYIKDRRKQQ